MSSVDHNSPTYSSLTDAELLTLIVNERDPGAVQALIEKHSTLLMSVCWQILQNQTDAEDAFQAMIVHFVRDADQIRKPNFVSTWLYRVAQREAINILRRRKRETIRSSEELSQMQSQLKDVSQDQLDELVSLHEELDQLPEKYRAPLVLCYLEGKSRQEAALELDVTENSIKASLATGRKKLHKRLLKRGVVLTSVLTAWNATQVDAGTSLSSILMQQTIQSALGHSPVTAAGTTSFSSTSTSIGSQGAFSKGTTWMAVSTGKKVLAGIVGTVILIGGATSVLLTKTEQKEVSEPTPEQTPLAVPIEIEDFPSQEMQDIIAQIKENEKL